MAGRLVVNVNMNSHAPISANQSRAANNTMAYHLKLIDESCVFLRVSIDVMLVNMFLHCGHLEVANNAFDGRPQF